jgi:dTDP-4-amino-4,6-dideoxygalactose transaminase
MSSWARRVLERTDLDAVRLRRQANAAALHARMRGAPGFRPVVDPLPPGAVPMFYPVWAPERGRLQGELAARGIGTFVFGGHLAEGLPAREFPEAGDLSAHVLGIPVHQDMDDKAVDHLVGGLMACLHT